MVQVTWGFIINTHSFYLNHSIYFRQEALLRCLWLMTRKSITWPWRECHQRLPRNQFLDQELVFKVNCWITRFWHDFFKLSPLGMRFKKKIKLPTLGMSLNFFKLSWHGVKFWRTFFWLGVDYLILTSLEQENVNLN
jgi:hypothetical protein